MQRLKTRRQFKAVLAGDRVAATVHFALHRCALIDDTSRPGQVLPRAECTASLFALTDVWLGAMVPKRWAKRAVTRNTIKRQIYNVSTEFELALPKAAHVVRLRSGFDRATFVSASSAVLKLAVRNELTQLFFKATQDLTGRQTSGVAQ